VGDSLKHDIHIWIGKESSQDEYGTAAYKMVEADESLGGAAVQHREIQGRESELFLSYFDTPLTILSGGCESGFTHVEATVDQPHLYRVKGTERSMSLTQMPLSKSSLNAGDSFILFANKSNVFVWHGVAANPDEKSRSNTVAENMCTQGTVTFLDQGTGDDEVEAFWKYLEDDGDIADADEDDHTVEEFAPLLFKLGDDGATQVAKGEPVKVSFGKASAKIPRSALEPSDVFLLDSGWEIFVWIGEESDRSEKISAMARADVYCKEDPRTADLPLTLVKSGYETSTFNAYFFDA
jgi:gelsolin